MNFKGKTIEDAINQALNFLKVSKEEIEITVIKEPTKRLLGLIGNKEAIINVVLKNTSIEELLKETDKITNKEIIKNNSLNSIDKELKIEKSLQFLKEIINMLDYNVEYCVTDEKDFIKIDIKGENIGSLIGKRGETLYAFQYLVNLIANKNDENRLKFILDIEHFRKKREKTLFELANRLALQVIKTKKNISLEPMHPIERKIIHMALQENKKIETFSEGLEGRRFVKIILKKTHI